MIKNREDFGAVVPPLTTEAIAQHANAVRELLGLTDHSYFPIDRVYDYLDYFVQDAYFEVLEVHEMDHNLGSTVPHLGVIRIRHDVFNDACRGDGRARFTLCHEFGHLLLHRGVELRRAVPGENVPIYRSSEWQGDTFAANLLMPSKLIRFGATVDEVAFEFGVSREAAAVRLSKLQKQRAMERTP